jgi:hypothetical protein
MAGEGQFDTNTQHRHITHKQIPFMSRGSSGMDLGRTSGKNLEKLVETIPS